MTSLSAKAILPATDSASCGTTPAFLAFRPSGVKGGSARALTSMVSTSYLAERTSLAASRITLVLDSSLMQESMTISFSIFLNMLQIALNMLQIAFQGRPEGLRIPASHVIGGLYLRMVFLET